MLYYKHISLKEEKSMAEKSAKKSVKKTTVKKPVSIVTSKTAASSKVAKVSRGQALLNKYKTVNFKNSKLIAAFIAEFIGTFMFVAFYMGTQGDPRYAMFALIGIALIIGGITGAAVNPALTIAAWVTRKIKSAQAVCFLLAQLLGAAAAWTVVSAYAKGTVAANAAMTSAPSVFKATALTTGKEWFVFFAEILGAAILAFGLAAALKFKKNNQPAINGALAYGFALYIAMFITYIMLSSMGTGLVFFNPAVAFAAAGITFKLWPIAVYIVAPIIGAILGFVIQDILHSQIDISVKEEK